MAPSSSGLKCIGRCINSVIQANQKHVDKGPFMGHTKSVTNGKLTDAKKTTLSRDTVSVFWKKCRPEKEDTSFKAYVRLPNRRERSALATELYLLEIDENRHKSTKLWAWNGKQAHPLLQGFSYEQLHNFHV
jgi:hypothetical protein